MGSCIWKSMWFLSSKLLDWSSRLIRLERNHRSSTHYSTLFMFMQCNTMYVRKRKIDLHSFTDVQSWSIISIMYTKHGIQKPIRTPAHLFDLFVRLHSAEKDTNSAAVSSPSPILLPHQGEFCFSFTADVHGNGYMWIEQNPMRCQRQTNKKTSIPGPFPSSETAETSETKLKATGKNWQIYLVVKGALFSKRQTLWQPTDPIL